MTRIESADSRTQRQSTRVPATFLESDERPPAARSLHTTDTPIVPSAFGLAELRIAAPFGGTSAVGLHRALRAFVSDGSCLAALCLRHGPNKASSTWRLSSTDRGLIGDLRRCRSKIFVHSPPRFLG